MFSVQVGVYQGSVLIPLLFIIVLSLEFQTGCPWEHLYVDDLVIIAGTMYELLYKLDLWKKHLEAKGLRVNMEKTKIMICGKNLHSLKDSAKHHCGACHKWVGSNSIFGDGCQSWIHKKCSGFKGRLKAGPNYRCKICMGLCRLVDGRPEKHVTLDRIQLDVVESFHYLGDKISPGGGCELATIARTRAAWRMFYELFPLRTSTTISLARHGKLYNIVSEVLYFMLANVGLCLLCNEQAMLCFFFLLNNLHCCKTNTCRQ